MKPSLVEWKLYPYLCNKGLGINLETFLGGMETTRRRHKHERSSALKPSLVEWKHESYMDKETNEPP